MFRIVAAVFVLRFLGMLVAVVCAVVVVPFVMSVVSAAGVGLGALALFAVARRRGAAVAADVASAIAMLLLFAEPLLPSAGCAGKSMHA